MIYRHPTRPGAIVIAPGGQMKYIYVIEKASDGSYSAFVPDLPGCTTSGDTIDEVKSQIKDAVESYIDALREHNEVVPLPSSIADVVEAA